MRFYTSLCFSVFILTAIMSFHDAIEWITITTQFNDIYLLRLGARSTISTDSLMNLSQALKLSEITVDEIFQNIYSGDTVLLNWQGMAIIGALIFKVFGVPAGLGLTFFINVSFLYAAIQNYRKICKHLKIHIPMISIIAIGISPMIIRHIWSLSKEPISVFFISALALVLVKRKHLILIPIAIFVPIVRTQYLAIIAIAYFSRLSRYWLPIAFASISLIAPFLNIISQTDFFEVQDAAGVEISSKAIMLYILETFNFVGGYLVQLPARITLNTIAPIAQVSSYLGTLDEGIRPDVLSYITYGISLFLVTIKLLIRTLKRDISSPILLNLVIATFLVIGLIPFLQPRYLMPILPIMYILAFAPKKGTVQISKRPRFPLGPVKKKTLFQ